MNRRPPGSLSLSKAIAGFLQYKAAEGLSPNTLQSYQRRSQIVAGICRRHSDQPDHDRRCVQDYFVWLRTDYQPRRVTGATVEPSPRRPSTTSTSALSAFFTWASREFDLAQSDQGHPRSRSLKRHPIEPFTKEEVEALLKACEYCNEAQTTDRRKFTMRRATGQARSGDHPDLAGYRLARFGIVGLESRRCRSQDRQSSGQAWRLGGAKGGKGRTVFLGKAARRAVWRYLAEREDGEDPEAPLFLVKYDRPMNKNALRLLIVASGSESGREEMSSPSFQAHVCDHVSAIGRRCVYLAGAAWAQHAGYGAALRAHRRDRC